MAMDPELKKKLLFTLLVLVLYRIGAHIAAPGVNVQALSDFIRNSAAAGFFGLYDMLGGGLSRATVFALGIMPFISASIIFQLAGGVVPTVGKMHLDRDLPGELERVLERIRGLGVATLLCLARAALVLGLERPGRATPREENAADQHRSHPARSQPASPPTSLARPRRAGARRWQTAASG